MEEEEEEEGTMMRALEAPRGLFLSLLQGLFRFVLFHPGGHIEMALVLVQRTSTAFVSPTRLRQQESTKAL